MSFVYSGFLHSNFYVSNNKYTSKPHPIVIFTHGMYYHGGLYAEMLFAPLRDMCIKNNITNVSYYRCHKVTHKTERRIEIFDVDFEYEHLMKLLSEFEHSHNIKNSTYIFVGHSLGGFYAHQFGLKSKKKCTRSISLDGSDFYNLIPMYIEKIINKPVDDTVKYGPEDVKYKNKTYKVSDLCNTQLYDMLYPHRDDDDTKHIIIDFEPGTDTPKIVPKKSKHYKHMNVLQYGSSYSHSLHRLEECSQLIFDGFIKKLMASKHE